MEEQNTSICTELESSPFTICSLSATLDIQLNMKCWRMAKK